MKSECSKFLSDMADCSAGRYEYISDPGAFLEHLEECAHCRTKLFGMKDLIKGFQKAQGFSPKFIKRMVEIKKMARQGPYKAPPTSGPSFRNTIKQGVALYKQGKYLEAKNVFEGLVVVLSPNQNTLLRDREQPSSGRRGTKPTEEVQEILSDAYYHLGLTYEKLNNTTEALADFSSAIELSPYDADPYYHRSLIYSQMNQPQQALNDLSSAIRHNPDYTEAYFDRAGISFLSGKLQEALADCERGLAIEPLSPHFYIVRAMIYELLGRYKESIADCNMALKTFTDEDRNEITMLYAVRGRSYAVALEFGMALLDFNKLIQLTPRNGMAYFYRGVVYANMEVLDKAIADFKKGLELKPGEPNIRDSLIQAEKELKAGDLQKKLQKKAKPAGGVLTKVRNQTEKLEAEINQLKGEIKTIKEMLIEIVRPRPEYSIPAPMPEVGIFRIPVRPTIIMPIPDKKP